MSTEPLKYLVKEQSQDNGGNIEIADENTYSDQYGDNKYVYSTHVFLTTKLTQPTLLNSELIGMENYADGHCFYHAVLRYILSTPKLMELVIDVGGESKPLFEWLKFKKGEEYVQDIKNILASQTCVSNDEIPDGAKGTSGFFGSNGWMSGDCAKYLYRKIFLLRKLLIDFALDHNDDNRYLKKDVVKVLEDMKSIEILPDGPDKNKSLNTLLPEIKKSTSKILKGAMKALLLSLGLEGAAKKLSENPSNIEAENEEMYLMSVLLKTNIYIQGDINNILAVFTRDFNLYIDPSLDYLASLKGQPSLLLLNRGGNHFDTYLPTSVAVNTEWLETAFDKKIDETKLEAGLSDPIINEEESDADIPYTSAVESEKDNVMIEKKTEKIKMIDEKQKEGVKDIEEVFNGNDTNKMILYFKEAHRRAQSVPQRLKEKDAQKNKWMNQRKSVKINILGKTETKDTDIMLGNADLNWNSVLESGRKLKNDKLLPVRADSNYKKLLVDHRDDVKKFVVQMFIMENLFKKLDIYIKSNFERLKNYTKKIRLPRISNSGKTMKNFFSTTKSAPVISVKGINTPGASSAVTPGAVTTAPVNPGSGPAPDVAPGDKAAAPGSTLVAPDAAPDGTHVNPGSGPAPVIAAVPGSGPAPAANVPVMAASSAKAATNPSVASVASSGSTAVAPASASSAKSNKKTAKNQSGKLSINIILTGEYNEIETIITNLKTEDLSVAQTHKFFLSLYKGYTYLDIAAKRVFKAKEFDETTESKIIYNLLKSKEFTHSNKYLKIILAKIITISSSESAEFNFDKTILDGTVILDKSYNIHYIKELKKINADKLLALGLSQDSINFLKPSQTTTAQSGEATSGEATSGEEEQQPSLLDLVKNGTIDDIAPLITETLNKNEQIGKNGETYLDFAAYRVEKNCNLARALGRSPDCLANIKIYNYLKENGFEHSENYKGGELKEFMIFMIQKLQFLNYDTPENSIQLKKLFNGVVLNYDNNDQMDLNEKDPYVEGDDLKDYKKELANLANIKFTFGLMTNNKLPLLGFTPDMITDLKKSPEEVETQSATTPAETQPAAIVATTPEAASAQQKPIRKSNNQQVAVVQEIKKQRKEAGLEDEEGKPSEIQEIYEAVENMDDEGKNNGELLNEVVETKIESLITKIANFYAQDNHYSVVGNEKVLSVYLETKYKFTYDDIEKTTTIYDYVADKYDSNPPLNTNQKDQLSLVMVTLLRNMGWKKSQAKSGTYVNDYGLRPPGNWDSLSNQLIELPMANDKKNRMFQSTEKYVPMIANMRDSNFVKKIEELNQIISTKLSGIKGLYDSRKQDFKIEYLNKVKAEIEKISVKTEENPQGLLIEDNIITLKMTIVVWKVLSMTPVQQNLPDQYLVDSINPFDEGNFTNYLDMMMEVFEDDDEKELYFTGKYRLENGKSYIIDSNGNFNVGGSTQPQSLLDLIKLHTLESDRPTMIDLIGQKFPAGSSIRTLIEEALAPAQPDVTAAQPDNQEGAFSKIRNFASNIFGLLGSKKTGSDEKQGPVESSSSGGGGGGTQTVGGRKLRKTKKKKANKKKNRKTRSKKSKNQRKKK